MTAVRSFFRGLGCPQQADVFSSVCGAKYNACYFCCAVAQFSACCISQAFAVPSANLERKRLHPLRRTVGGLTRSRFSVMLSIIITLEIVNWLGAVIMLGVRQFDESGGCFFANDVV